MTTDPNLSGAKSSEDLDALIKAARDKAVANSGPTPQNAPSSEASGPQNMPATSPDSVPQKTEGIAKIRTFEHDAKTAIEDTNASLARMKLAEDKRERIANNPRSSSGIFWIILVVLILVGAGISGYLFYTKGTAPEVTEPTVVAEKPEALLPYDMLVDTDIKSINSISNEALGTTYIRVYENNESAQFENVASLLFGEMNATLSRNVSDYMIGLQNGSRFLIAKSQYKYALPGMLAWEKQFRNMEFTDNFVTSGIFRNSNDYAYIVLENGFVIISESPETVQNIARIL